MSRRRTGRFAGVTLAVTLLWAAALAIACGPLGGDDNTQEGPSTPEPEPALDAEEALRLFVQRRLNQGFVADCDEARRPDDVAKQCARFVGSREGLRAYELGPTFSEPTRLIILEQLGDSWTIGHLENRDPSLPLAPGIPWPLAIGSEVVVAGTGECLRVRDQPGLDGEQIACVPDGTQVTISDGPVDIDNFQWWELRGWDLGGSAGWSASNWLRYPEEVPTALPEAEG